jgi:hypothetical protein
MGYRDPRVARVSAGKFRFKETLNKSLLDFSEYTSLCRRKLCLLQSFLKSSGTDEAVANGNARHLSHRTHPQLALNLSGVVRDGLAAQR